MYGWGGWTAGDVATMIVDAGRTATIPSPTLILFNVTIYCFSLRAVTDGARAEVKMGLRSGSGSAAVPPSRLALLMSLVLSQRVNMELELRDAAQQPHSPPIPFSLLTMAAAEEGQFLKQATGRNTRGLLRVVILCLIAAAAVSSRLFSVIRFESIIHECRYPNMWDWSSLLTRRRQSTRGSTSELPNTLSRTASIASGIGSMTVCLLPLGTQ
jgi:hypothetical protein